MNDLAITQSVFSSAFKEFSTCLEIIGPEKTETVLKNYRYSSTAIADADVSFVLQLVTDNMKIEVQELLYSRKWSKKRICAIGICCYVFSHYFDYSYSKIKLIMKKKNKQDCSRYIQVFKKLSSKNEEEKAILDNYKVIETNVKNYLKK